MKTLYLLFAFLFPATLLTFDNLAHPAPPGHAPAGLAGRRTPPPIPPKPAPLSCGGGSGCTPCDDATLPDCNRALYFDGQDDEILLPAPLWGTGDLTIEAWARSDDNGEGNFDRILLWGSSGYRFEIGEEAGQLLVLEYDGSFHKHFGPNIQDGEWHHIALSRASGVMSVYLDGSLALSFNSVSVQGEYIRLGYWPGTDDEYWRGPMDEFRIWAYARTQAEIQENMFCQLSGEEPGLGSYYDFNQGIPGGDNSGEMALLDRSGNGFDGELFGFNLDGDISNFVRSDSPVNSCCRGTKPVDCGPCKNGMLANGSFEESDGFPVNWAMVGGTPQYPTNDGCDGGASIQMWGNRDLGEAVEQTSIAFEAGRTYRVSFCARFLEMNLPTPYVYFRFRASNSPLNNFNCASGCEVMGVSEPISSSGWACHEFTYTAAAEYNRLTINATNDVPDVSGDNTTVSWGRIDDICIEDITATNTVQEEEPGLKVWPNPTLGTLTLQLGGAAPGAHWVRIMEAGGRIVLARKIEAGARQATFSLLGLPAGLYWVVLSSEEGRITAEKIVKQ